MICMFYWFHGSTFIFHSSICTLPVSKFEVSFHEVLLSMFVNYGQTEKDFFPKHSWFRSSIICWIACLNPYRIMLSLFGSKKSVTTDSDSFRFYTVRNILTISGSWRRPWDGCFSQESTLITKYQPPIEEQIQTCHCSNWSRLRYGTFFL